MHAGDNKTEGHTHATFLKKHLEVDKVKDTWIAVATAHMKKFYVQNQSGSWSVASITKNGIHTIPKWKPYPPEPKTEYLRLHFLTENRDA
jgi:hypothetical protein